jgi:hypothetical protein
MKKVLLLTALMLPLTAGATTMSLSSPATGPGVFASDATTLVPNGSIIRIGTVSNVADPVASFVEFGTGSVRSVGIGATAKPGKVAGSVTPTESESAHDKFNNQKIFVWLYNGTSSLTSSQQGLFSTSVNFPLNDGPTGLNDNVTLVSATDITGVVSIPGWIDAQILPGDANNSKKFVLGGVIPEPTSTTLSGLVALGFLARRTRA